MTKRLTVKEKLFRKVLRDRGYLFEQVRMPSCQEFRAPSVGIVMRMVPGILAKRRQYERQ